MHNGVLLLCLAMAPMASASTVSPVQKVLELIAESKAKVERDMAAENQEMDEYMGWCNTELREKKYATQTADRQLSDLQATIEDAEATIESRGEEIQDLSKEIAAKDAELYKATDVRKIAHEDFLFAEKENEESIKELEGAVQKIKADMSFTQMGSKGRAKHSDKRIKAITQALSKLVEAQSLDAGSRHKLKALLQGKASEENDLSLEAGIKARQMQPETPAYESQSGGILETVEELQGKAEESLTDLRKKEMQENHAFQLAEQGLQAELKAGQEKLDTATKGKAAASETLATSQKDVVAITTTKNEDHKYMKTLKLECQAGASTWAERQESGKDELAALAKATEILSTGVKASFVQVGGSKSRLLPSFSSEESDAETARRTKLVTSLRTLAHDHHSFALMQLVNAASADPFGKIRGLIEGMIEKLMSEASGDATHEAFCREEMAKATKSQEKKQGTADMFQTRIDQASAGIEQLSDDIKTLEQEIADIDSAQAEATKLRTEENHEYRRASADFRDSADAVNKAIAALNQYYNGALVQVSIKTARRGTAKLAAKQPSMGGAQSDSAGGIISVLEQAEADFTRLLAEAETAEQQGKAAYEKLSEENKISRKSKEMEVRGKISNRKSMSVTLSHSKEDHLSVTQELQSVLDYLEKLKPECETKVESYSERKAAREAEVEGLKEALGILEGKDLAYLLF